MAIHGIISPVELDMEITEEEDKSYEEQIEHLKYVRGNIIEMLLVIENNIDVIITYLLVKDNKKIKKVFRKKYLNSITITFSRKLDLFYELIKTTNCKIEFKKFEKSLKFLSSERNKWAHGKIFFMRKLVDNKLVLEPILLYNDGKGDNKSKKFNDEYIEKINSKIDIVFDEIDNLIEELEITNDFILKDYQ
jgi:hypothetical protein